MLLGRDGEVILSGIFQCWRGFAERCTECVIETPLLQAPLNIGNGVTAVVEHPEMVRTEN